jgi:hypothetical protein
MVLELLDHRQPEDGLVRGVHKYVDPYETGKELSLMCGHH